MDKVYIDLESKKWLIKLSNVGNPYRILFWVKNDINIVLTFYKSTLLLLFGILMSKHLKHMQSREPSPLVQSNLEWFLIYPISTEQNSKTKEKEKQKKRKGRCFFLVRGNSETVCWHEGLKILEPWESKEKS